MNLIQFLMRLHQRRKTFLKKPFMVNMVMLLKFFLGKKYTNRHDQEQIWTMRCMKYTGINYTAVDY